MRHKPEHRDSWRREWLASISELGDIDLQRQRWLDLSNTNPHWSFIEFVQSYFDLNLDQSYADVLASGYVTPDEFLAVQNFHDALKRYASPRGNGYDNEGILADPAWHLVVEAATDAKQRLLALATAT